MKKYLFFSFCFLLLFSFIYPVFSQTETITLTTYYPSPVGVYRELRTQRLAVGENYYAASEYCWSGTCTNTIDADADLVVEGNVGIGTNSPTTIPSPANNQATGNLDVNDIFLRSTGQFVSQIVGTLVQTVYVQNDQRLLTSNPIDNHSLPSISDGLEFLRVSIRPTNANNRLRIRVQAIVDQSGHDRSANMVLFRGSTPIAGSHLQFSESAPGFAESAFLEFETTAGTTNPVSFTVRFGPHGSSSGTAAVNGRVDGPDYGRLGGIVISTMVVDELLLPN